MIIDGKEIETENISFEKDYSHESAGGFIVDNDQKAEWALLKIKNIRNEKNRLIDVCKVQLDYYNSLITGYENSAANEESYFLNQLESYFANVPHTQTKTLDKYELPSGVLVRKFKKGGFEKCDNLLEKLQESNMVEFIKTTPSIKWAELKETLKVIDEKIVSINADGEIKEIEGVMITADSSKFEVKL
jgi:hypothetical protein